MVYVGALNIISVFSILQVFHAHTTSALSVYKTKKVRSAGQHGIRPEIPCGTIVVTGEAVGSGCMQHLTVDPTEVVVHQQQSVEVWLVAC